MLGRFSFEDTFVTSRRGTLCSIALIFLACSVHWTAAAESKNRSTPPPQLPLGLDEFQSFVDKLAAEVDGSKAAMAERLQSLGFTCTPVSDSFQFACVRFGCKKWRGFLWRGALLQWSVTDYSAFSGKEFDAAAMSYSYARGCIAENAIDDAQTDFLSRLYRSRPADSH